uniref:ShKT domain-containing protein n=1 Tax=Strongyloides venezuelensis TaxID=75913 RepID=A0A0K0EV17_STRVS
MKFLIYLGFIFGMFQSILSDDCKDLSPHCRKNSKLCGDSVYGRIMKKNCARSCKYCTPPTKPTLAPMLRDRIHNCYTLIEHCHQKEFKNYMERNCKRTCSTVTPKVETTTLAPEETSSKVDEVAEGSGTIDGENNKEEIINTEDDE